MTRKLIEDTETNYLGKYHNVFTDSGHEQKGGGDYTERERIVNNIFRQFGGKRV